MNVHFWHRLDDTAQLWGFRPEEPPGVPFDPETDEVEVWVRRQGRPQDESVTVGTIAGDSLFVAPSSCPVINAPGPYDVIFRLKRPGDQILAPGSFSLLSFSNGFPLVAWVTRKPGPATL